MNNSSKTKDLRQVPLDQIAEPPAPLRSSISDEGIEELARSLEREGLHQPIQLTPDGANYRVLFGHRRLLAARYLGWPAIDAFIVPAPAQSGRLTMLTENIQREDLNPVDEARALSELTRDHHLSPPQLAHRLGKSAAWVTSRLDLLTLGPDIAALVAAGHLSIAGARALLILPTSEWQLTLAQQAAEHGATVNLIEHWCQDTLRQIQRQRAAGLPETPPQYWTPPPPARYPCWACREPKLLTDLRTEHICHACHHQLEALASQSA